MSRYNNSFQRCVACNRPLPLYTKVCPYCDERLPIPLRSDPNTLITLVFLLFFTIFAYMSHYCLGGCLAALSVVKGLFHSKAFTLVYSLMAAIILYPYRQLHFPGKPGERCGMLLLRALFIRIELLAIVTIVILLIRMTAS